MNIKYCIACLFCIIIATSCSENTGNIGGSLISKSDSLDVLKDTFDVETRSILSGAIVSRDANNYLGRVIDPETGATITSSFMTQLHSLDNFNLPPRDSIISKNENGLYADSCKITIYYDSYYGDSTALMQVNAKEMSSAMLDNRAYYSDFNPEQQPYITSQGFNVNKVFTATGRRIDGITTSNSTSLSSIVLDLNGQYTKDNKTYSNYGTYVLQQYDATPNYFRTPLSFIQNINPGIYFKITSGIGSMARVRTVALDIYYRYRYNGTTSVGVASFSGTEEVLSFTRIINNEEKLQSLVNNNDYTYIKSPAGIFTEVTLPIDEIMRGHERDTLNTAKIVFNRINDAYNSTYNFSVPTNILMIPKNQMKSFFENNQITDNRTSFLATYNSTYNNYTFNNISGLIMSMNEKRATNNSSRDWNKVVLIPIATTYTRDGSNNVNILTSISNDMSLQSTKLVGGSNSQNGKVKISVIYSKFK